MSDGSGPKPSDNVLLDRTGSGADEKVRFELSRKIIGRKVTGVRFCSDEPYEDGRRGATITFSFEDGGTFMAAVPGGDIELFISMAEHGGDPTPGRVM